MNMDEKFYKYLGMCIELGLAHKNNVGGIGLTDGFSDTCRRVVLNAEEKDSVELAAINHYLKGVKQAEDYDWFCGICLVAICDLYPETKNFNDYFEMAQLLGSITALEFKEWRSSNKTGEEK